MWILCCPKQPASRPRGPFKSGLLQFFVSHRRCWCSSALQRQAKLQQHKIVGGTAQEEAQRSREMGTKPLPVTLLYSNTSNTTVMEALTLSLPQGGYWPSSRMTLPQPCREGRGLIPIPAISALRRVFICVLSGGSAGCPAPLRSWGGMGNPSVQEVLEENLTFVWGRKEQPRRGSIVETPFRLQAAFWKEAPSVKGDAAVAAPTCVLQPLSDWRLAGTCFLPSPAVLQGKLIKLFSSSPGTFKRGASPSAVTMCSDRHVQN